MTGNRETVAGAYAASFAWNSIATAALLPFHRGSSTR